MMWLALGVVLAGQASGTELTVYNQGFALVKEQRVLQLRIGVQDVAVEDVAQMIEANSVGIRSLSDPGSFTVLEQNYQFDLISPAAILAKAVGNRIALNRVLPNGQKERVVGVLLSAPTAVVSDGSGRLQTTFNGMVLQADDGRILLDPSGEVEVSEIPEGLISKPTLLWVLDSRKAGPNRIEMSYISQGFGWKADYVLQLDGDGKLGDFKGWVTMTNNSGTTFRDARLNLLAGDVQRVQAGRQRGGFGGAAMEMKVADAAPGFAQEEFAYYHLYTLQRPATLRNREVKQISLMEAFRVPATKKLVVDFMRGFHGYQPNEGIVGSGVFKPLIQVIMTNDEKSNLGMPLPMGTIKVFQRDSRGSLQMLGEDSIQHTPKNEKVTLTVGRAFDVVAERKRTFFQWIQAGGRNRGAVETFEIEIRNRKTTPEVVTVLERHWGEWRITDSNMPHTRPDANTAEFVLNLAPDEVKKIVYSVETRW